MPASKEVRAKVTGVLVQALGLDEDEIKHNSTLQGDLGAESIDFLDIMFRLEREFVIKIRQGELFGDAIFRRNAEIVQDGRVTDEGLAALRAQLPFADWSDLERDRRPDRIEDLFTVGLLSSFITWKLGESGKACSDARAPGLVTSSLLHQ